MSTRTKGVLIFLVQNLLKSFLFIFAVLFFLYAGNLAGRSFFPEKRPPVLKISEGEIGPGETLYQVLSSDFSVLQAVQIGNSLSEVFNTSRIRPGDSYRIYHSTSGQVLKFIYEPGPLLNYVVRNTTSGFVSGEYIPEYEKKVAAVKAEIGYSLWQGMASAGLSPNMIMNFANIFQWQIDFLTEVRRGDRFMMVFERFYRDGEPVQDGSIIAAWYEGRVAGSAEAIRFETGEGAGYYDSAGNSVRKQFLRAPLNYTRISSGFTYARRHPITRQVRPHLSIDYAAPTGTPVQSVASGRVVYVGWRGGWGQTVQVRHNSVYTTQYAHLSRYASGIRVGTNVSQGQVIGYVGMTGTATGPHLCFRIEHNGRPVNYLALEFPPADSVSDENMDLFNKETARARAYQERLEDDRFLGQIAALEKYGEPGEYAALSE